MTAQSMKLSIAACTTFLIFGAATGLPASAGGNLYSFIDAAASAVDYRATPLQATRDCKSLASEVGSGVQITSAEVIPASSGSPEHCRLNGVIPTEIGFQINLPMAWNGRIYMYGNGGYAGEDPEAPREQASRQSGLANGFVTARTDTGHLAAKEPLGTFAVNPDKVVDHGYRAVHETIVLAKRLASTFYGSSPRYSYWDGCSTGGRQGVMAAQRYPDDFNGILAAAPTLQWSQIMMKGLWNRAALEGSGLTASKMSNVFKAVAAKCDAQDGLRDGLMDDPRQCRFDPASDMPRCAAGAEGAECLTNRQVDALQLIYSGPKNSRGEQLFVSQVPGSEDESTIAPFLILPDNAPNLLTVFAASWMKYLAFGDPNYDPKSFDFDRDPSRTGRVDEIFNPTADLSLFKERGGKMVTFWGWADNALNPQMGLNYYDRLRAKYGASEYRRSFYRFFLVPGRRALPRRVWPQRN